VPEDVPLIETQAFAPNVWWNVKGHTRKLVVAVVAVLAAASLSACGPSDAQCPKAANAALIVPEKGGGAGGGAKGGSGAKPAPAPAKPAAPKVAPVVPRSVPAPYGPSRTPISPIFPYYLYGGSGYGNQAQCK
jgi:hypothetical protein